MENIIRLTGSELTKYTSHRSGEIKFGERILTIPTDVPIWQFVKECDADFVLFGIPEDIGVRANFGRPGTASAWESTLKSIVNIQHNKFCKGSKLLILGHIDVSAANDAASNLDVNVASDRKTLSSIIDNIDKEVSHIVRNILIAGKTPIIIGGGHNNAYGNIKGTALAKGKPVNAINFDAHTDFRILEGRHSGNGFSYAFEEGFLKKYFIFGLHENYTSKGVIESIKKMSDRIKFNTYEQIAVRREKNFADEMGHALGFIEDETFGIEIDLDALPNIASSAITPTGFSIETARQFLHYFGRNKNAAYLHICEGAPELDNEMNRHLTGKLIAYLITDFIKSKEL
ncbi:formimidoylglutamase [Flavobacterium salilacus subsp. salilacus]|uniref:formimidoylglutamase n=1 Tax=Flavobacterium TaxID=237 RepID=UPI001074EA0C|nr:MULTISPECIES: formimidoylglutamase [Flavobacterium]KAF2516276.1 formimidoylglutamase [Flavobacterium salilacus subsp. salilacus]MBE1613806.1 formimidoylglutamase [Flavobacterium sp. SaA2.13]NDI99947.1 formimidoylglutamase [Flavobacterium salilacus subsp. altitudinum]